MAREYVLQPFRGSVDLRIDYERELNAQQLSAVTAPPGPALVIAGAGAGKTRALTYRVAFLIEQGVPADRILLLTFTNKAAREMMRRVAELLGNDLSDLWGGTFHSVGHRVLRRHAERLGATRDFTILDREDATDLLRSCVDAQDIDVTKTRFPKADVVADMFSKAANTDEPLGRVVRERYEHFADLLPILEPLQAQYTARKREDRLMDFDDLLVLWRRLLLEHDDLREHYQRQFQFVLVDEYQDTNRLQAGIVDCIAARHHNVMAVGDDAQSIYSWRGANFRNILEFPKRYPEAKVYRIETNYRSTPEILAVANAAIAANTMQFAKVLAPSRRPGIRPGLVPCQDSTEQAVFVARRVLQLRDEGTDLRHMAVLYRAHFHAVELQLELTRHNIPFSITSGIRFFEQAHIKDVTAHLRIVVNPRDEIAFKRVIRLLPGVGGRTADRLWKAFHNALPSPEVTPARALQSCAEDVPKKTAAAWAQLSATVDQLCHAEIRSNPARAIQLVIHAGYEDHLKDQYPNYRERLEDVVQLGVFAKQFESLEDFLGQLALLTSVQDEDSPASRDTEEGIRLSTIHQAKGLEFDVVFVIMLCEGLFPSHRSLKEPDALEEERRLFYVALTRARNELYLSYPITRASSTADGGFFQHPSRFLGEIPEDLREEWNLRRFG